MRRLFHVELGHTLSRKECVHREWAVCARNPGYDMRILSPSYFVEEAQTIGPGNYIVQHYHIGSALPVFLRDGTTHCMCIFLVVQLFVTGACERHTRFD